MGVKVIIQDNQGNDLGNFIAEDNKAFSKMAKEHGIEIMTSCGMGACGICKCKVIKGKEYVQIDKINKPLSDLRFDENGLPDVIFTCIAGVKSQYIDDGNDYEIVLKRNI